jgi:hypothetical protein
LWLIGAVALIMLGGLAGGYTWYWYQLADGVHDSVNIWLGQRRAAGLQAEAGPIEVSGYPFDLVAAIGQAVLGRGAAGEPGAWRWRGKALELRLSPLAPSRIYLATTAPQMLEFTNARGESLNFRARADTAGGVIDLGLDGRLTRFQGDIRILVLSSAALPGPVAVRRLRFDLQPRGRRENHALDLSAQADALHLPKNSNAVLGDVIDVVRLDATVSGPPPGRWTAPAVSAWRDNGGTVEITRARIKWGSLDVAAVGTATLDERMRPLFSATGALKGYLEIITAYKKSGLISPLKAAGLTIALNMLRRDAEGRVKISLAGQNGLLKVGPITVARLKPIPLPAE